MQQNRKKQHRSQTWRTGFASFIDFHPHTGILYNVCEGPKATRYHKKCIIPGSISVFDKLNIASHKKTEFQALI